MKRVLLALLLLWVTPAWAKIGPSCSLRPVSGHMVSPTAHWTGEAFVVRQAAGTYVVYTPADDTDASRGLELADYAAAAVDGDQVFQATVCDMATELEFTGIDFDWYGVNTTVSKVTSSAVANETTQLSGTCKIRNIDFYNLGGAATSRDSVLLLAGANVTFEYCTITHDGSVTFPGVWLNGGTPTPIASFYKCVIHSIAGTGGGRVTLNQCIVERQDHQTIAIYSNGGGTDTYLRATDCTFSDLSVGNNANGIESAGGQPAASGHTLHLTRCTIDRIGGTGSALTQTAAVARTYRLENVTLTGGCANGLRVTGATSSGTALGCNFNGSFTTADVNNVTAGHVLSYNSQSYSDGGTTYGATTLGTTAGSGTNTDLTP